MPLDLFFDQPKEIVEPSQSESNKLDDIHCMMEILFRVKETAKPSALFVINKLLEILYQLEETWFDAPARFDADVIAVRAKAHNLVEIVRESLAGPVLRGAALADAAKEVFPHKSGVKQTTEAKVNP